MKITDISDLHLSGSRDELEEQDLEQSTSAMPVIARNGKDNPDTPWGWAERASNVNSIGPRELLRVYRVRGFQECSYSNGKRHPKCKKNPHCLWGLGDHHWRGEDFGDSAEQSQIRDEGQIAGLLNQGQTCYVNSLLQLWYHNPILRPAILSWEPPAHTIRDPKSYIPVGPVSQLQTMFARMKASKQRTIDTQAFVGALSLDAGLQQDAQEFAKLLLACVTDQLDASPENASISSIFKTCFTGEVLYQTTCESCRTVTLGRTEEFNELQLPVLSTLHDSFLEYFKEERLDGDNKYLCNGCVSKQNAIRKLSLLKLPQVLNIQLMRFVFDPVTLDKKKVMRNIVFPEELDMTGYLDTEANVTRSNGLGPKEKHKYMLNAVLIHNGNRASSGHYISHIKDLVSGVWFECNDEKIAKIDKKGYSKKLVMKNEDGEGVEIEQSPEVSANTSTFSSRGAYMLVYTLQKYFEKEHADPELPEFLSELIKGEDEVIEVELEKQKLEKESKALKRVERQAEIDLLYKSKYPSPTPGEKQDVTNAGEGDDNLESTGLEIIEPAPSPSAQPHVNVNTVDFIATDWLELWLNSNPLQDPPPIENEGILCRHKHLKPPRKTDAGILYKIIPSTVADVLYARYNGHRLSGENAFCMECVKSHWEYLQALIQLDVDMKKTMESVTACDLELERRERNHERLTDTFHGDKCLIGKESLRDWKKHAKALLEQRDRGDTSSLSQEEYKINEELRCPHGNLGINRSLWRRIHVDAFLLIIKYFPDAVWYGSGQEECGACKNLEEKNKVVLQQYKQYAFAEREKLRELYKGENRPNSHTPGEFCLVPTTFITEWREFLRNPTSNPPINVPTEDLLCDIPNCSDCLIPKYKYPFESLQIYPDVTEKDLFEHVTMVRPTEMRILLEKRAIDQDISVHISIDPLNPCQRKYAYNVEICQSATGLWVASLIESKYNYEDHIIVRKVDEDEEPGLENMDDENFPTKFLRGENDPLNGQPRRSGRRRQHRDERKYRIHSATKIREFMVNNLYCDFKTGLSDQHLYWQGKELTSAEREMSFSELKIPPGSTIFLKIDKPLNNGDEEAMDVEVTEKRPAPQVERGFTGTALLQSSLPPRPSNTEPNPE